MKNIAPINEENKVNRENPQESANGAPAAGPGDTNSVKSHASEVPAPEPLGDPPLDGADGPTGTPGQGYASKARSFGRFRMAQNFDEVAGVSKVLIHASRLKPSPQSWFRVHPDEQYRMPVALLTLKDEKSEPYLVAPEIVNHVPGEVAPHLLVTYVTRQSVVGLWPLRLPRADGKTDSWLRTAHEAANLAMKQWVRMTANMAAGAYDVHVTSAPLPDPEWPDMVFEQLVEIAYRDHIIETLDHPVLRRLRGEA